MRYIIGNWKMNTTPSEAVTLGGRVADGLEDLAHRDIATPEVVICPPFTSLTAVHDTIDSRFVQLGAQNCHWADDGAYTGEISPAMLAGVAGYVLLGSSERRALGETDEQVADKVAAAARHGLVPMLMVGESDPTDIAIEHTEHQLRERLTDVDATKLENLLVIYEPEWAVGNDQPAPTKHIAEVIEHLCAVLNEEGAADAAVLYGGSINRANVTQFTEIAGLDGLLVGRSSLDPEEFIGIVAAVSE